LAERPALASQCIDLLGVDFRAWASNALAYGAGMGDACPNPLCDQISFELRHGTHDVEQQLAGGCGGVDPFGVGNEVDAQGSKLGKTVHQVFDRTRKTVELPDQDNVEPALASLTHELVQPGTPALSSTYAFVHELAAASESLAGIAS
jgi:hypothetical protein